MSVVSTFRCSSRVEVFGGYHEYTDVKSCQDVVHLHHLLWSATILNIVALFLGIITAAVLGSFKDMVGGNDSALQWGRCQRVTIFSIFSTDSRFGFREFV